MRTETAPDRSRSLPVALASLVVVASCSSAEVQSGADAGATDRDAGSSADPGGPCARELGAAVGQRELHRFESRPPGTTLHLEREYTGAGAGESSLFALRGLSVLHAGTCEHTEDPVLLDYENSHHNWADRAVAEIGGVRYTAAIDYRLDDGPFRWSVSLAGEPISGGAKVVDARDLVPTGGPLGCWTCPSFLPVWIFEVLPENDGINLDEAGEAEPWVELRNPSAGDVDVGGWELVAGGSAAGSWTLPAGTSIARHAFLIVWLDGEPSEGPLHASFRLPASGATLLLRDPQGVGTGERVFSSPGPGKSLDYSWSERAYVVRDRATPGAPSPGEE